MGECLSAVPSRVCGSVKGTELHTSVLSKPTGPDTTGHWGHRHAFPVLQAILAGAHVLRLGRTVRVREKWTKEGPKKPASSERRGDRKRDLAGRAPYLNHSVFTVAYPSVCHLKWLFSLLIIPHVTFRKAPACEASRCAVNCSRVSTIALYPTRRTRKVLPLVVVTLEQDSEFNSLAFSQKLVRQKRKLYICTSNILKQSGFKSHRSEKPGLPTGVS